MKGWAVSHDAQGVILTLAIPAAALLILRSSGGPSPYDTIIKTVAVELGSDWALLKAFGKVESSLNPYAVSPPNRNGTKDYGITQVNEVTARQYGIDPASLVGDAAAGFRLTARILSDDAKQLGTSASPAALISAYNQGVHGFLTNGIINWPYVAAVSWWQFVYMLAPSS